MNICSCHRQLPVFAANIPGAPAKGDLSAREANTVVRHPLVPVARGQGPLVLYLLSPTATNSAQVRRTSRLSLLELSARSHTFHTTQRAGRGGLSIPFEACSDHGERESAALGSPLHLR